MTEMKKTLLLATVAVGLLATVVVAQGHGDRHDDGMNGMGMNGMGMGMAGMGTAGPMQMDFATLDTNADGMITPEDWVARAEGRFAAADTNADGALTADELVAQIAADRAAREAAQAAAMIANLDANEDGVLQAAELADAVPTPVRMFDRFDTDSDEAISEAEFEAAIAEIADRGQRGDRHGDGWGFFGFGQRGNN